MTDVPNDGPAPGAGAPAEGERPVLSRRSMLELVALTTLATACDRGSGVARAVATRGGAAAPAAPTGSYTPTVFTPHEWDTVHVLVDLIIPRDERSGSATDAGVPEFMDRMLALYPKDVLPIRGGLAWLDHECVDRHGVAFLGCTDAQRKAVLDDIAWPKRARPELGPGVAFFTRFRDLTASGFFSSRMGVEDLRYEGNTTRPSWTGCPPEALAKLRV